MLTILLLLLWKGREVFLLLLAGVLLSLLLSAFTDVISRRTPLSRKAAYPVVLLLLVGVVTGAVWLAAPSVSRQVDELTESLPRAVARLTERIGEYRWASDLLEQVPAPEEAALSADSETLAQTTSFLSSTAGGVASFFIALFIGVYLGAQPDLYTRGLLHLVPPARRARAREVLEEISSTLRQWLLARFISMAIVGVFTTAGLWLLGVPLALTLGLLAALLQFIPNFGPILSAVPAVLLALVDSPRLALWVIVLYAGLQLVESYFITPLVQQRLASLPPVLVIVSQLLGGILFGFLGFALATPLLAVTMVLVKRLYVEDRLGETLGEPD